MSREVTVEELRENLEQIIAEVEAGETVTIVKELGQLRLSQKGRRFPFRDFVPGPRPENLTTDAVALIREDRDDEIRKHGF